MPDGQLVELAKEAGSLRKDVLPVLQKELRERGMEEHALLVDQYLKEEVKAIGDMTKEELTRLVSQRLADGESIENLKIYLRENGINIYGLLVDENEAINYNLPTGKKLLDIVSPVEEVTADDAVIETIKIPEEAASAEMICTLKEINVYADVHLSQLVRKEPANKLLPFKRELIRNGKELVLLQEADNQKRYVENKETDLVICTRCYAEDYPLDFLLMSHDDFRKYLFLDKVESRKIEGKLAEMATSHLKKEGSFLYATLIHTSSLVGEKMYAANVLTLRAEAAEKVTLARLEPDSFFYLVQENSMTMKIKLPDGREGVFPASQTFKQINSSLENAIQFIIVSLFVILFLGGIIVVANATGYIIVIGLMGVILFVLLKYLVGLPIYLLCRAIVKRL
jgi:hypothetical protein